MKLIPLSQEGKNRGNLFTQVDDDLFEELNKHKWFVLKTKLGFYAARNIPFGDKKQKAVKMHRVILGIIDPKIKGDHLDGVTLNNQRYNLRICTNAENCRNRSKQSSKTHSKYKGVTFHHGRWEARVTVDKKMIYLGSSKDEDIAGSMANRGLLEHHKEFARLNVIES